MDDINVYLAPDRRQALANTTVLPGHALGAVMFADISGFTTLTEAFERTLGTRHGAETMTQQINDVYDALLAIVDRFGGSVISFAGDAITCWFNRYAIHHPLFELDKENVDVNGQGLTNTALRAAACALALQDAMRAFAALALPDGTTTTLMLKVVVASGSARRFVVGNPDIHLIDVLAGSPLVRVAIGEQLAHSGEVLVDALTSQALGEFAQFVEWRTDVISGTRFAVLQAVNNAINEPTETHTEVAMHGALAADLLKPWLLAVVYARYQAGLGAFLTELRPTVALFLRFAGLDYDNDPDAALQLDAFIRDVQQVLLHYGGTLLQLTIGDKGSYLYAAFGAPVAHEDDARRACHAALDLQSARANVGALAPIHIGISQGIMRCGAYGGATRLTYGVLGDEVNLAARLMSLAPPNAIIVSERVQRALNDVFAFEPLSPVRVKGKADLLSVFTLTGSIQHDSLYLEEPVYALPMVGRENTLVLIKEVLEQTLAGRGQVVGVVAEAGMGKSRLVAESIGVARQRGLQGYGGSCHATGTMTPYLVWKPVWSTFFGKDRHTTPAQQERALADRISNLAPERLAFLPLLGQLLDLPIPENDTTRSLSPAARKRMLELTLVTCLQTAAQAATAVGQGLLFVIEDMHWIDPLSYDLLKHVARGIEGLPVLILLAYRPHTLQQQEPSPIEEITNFTRIVLPPLPETAVAELIQIKIAQLWQSHTDTLPSYLAAQVMTRAQGNPFYVEELVHYLHDLDIDIRNEQQLAALALPNSLHSLILSRIDQLSTKQQVTLKVASVLGRLFQVAWLHGAYPMLGELAPLKSNLDKLAQMELTSLSAPEPELTYLFKHVVTQEVAYESLSMQTKAELHERFAAYLEQLAGDTTDRYIDLLAYHYDRSTNLPKRRVYLWRAGEAAFTRYAMTSSRDYLSRALALAPTSALAERITLLLKREQALMVLGDRNAQAADLAMLEGLVETLNDDRQRIAVACRRADYAFRSEDYETSCIAAAQAVQLAQAIGAPELAITARNYWAWSLLEQGVYHKARTLFEATIQLALAHGLLRPHANALGGLGEIARRHGDYATTESVYMQQLAINEEMGDRVNKAVTLRNIAELLHEQGNYSMALTYLTQALSLARENSDRWTEAVAYGTQSRIAYDYGDYVTARALCEQALTHYRAIRDRQDETSALALLAMIDYAENNNQRAISLCNQALAMAQEIGEPNQGACVQVILGNVLLRLGQNNAAEKCYAAAQDTFYALGLVHLAMESLAGLAQVALASGCVSEAFTYVDAILHYLDGGGTTNGVNNRFQMYLTCYQVLQAGNDPRADIVLNGAYTRLQQQASQFTDATMRQMFLHNVLPHRTIVEIWEAQLQ